MPILLLIFALFIPRIVIVLLWLFSSWFTVVPNVFLGILGFLFFPYTLLWYAVVEQWFAGTWGALQIIVLVVAVAADLGFVGGTRYGKQR